MTTLAQYERARAALAEATSIDQVLPILDEVEHVKLYARQIADRELLADASVFQMRAERRLGIVISAAKEAGHFRQGKRGKSTEEELSRATLEEVGVDKKLSARAQKAASISERAYEAMMEARRAEIAAGKPIPATVHEINGARSIMGSRQEPDDSLDYFPTPPWATRALINYVFPLLGADPHGIAIEPACGEGHIAEVLRETFDIVDATDIHDYGYGGVFDFLTATIPAGYADWIITNPPFGDKTEQFVMRSLGLAKIGVAMFVRMQWLEGIGRYERIYRDNPPTLISFFTERVNLCKGRWDPEGGTATAYIWLVWIKGREPQAPFWIPPNCRKEMSRADDVERFTASPVARRLFVDEEGTTRDAATGEILDEVAA